MGRESKYYLTLTTCLEVFAIRTAELSLFYSIINHSVGSEFGIVVVSGRASSTRPVSPELSCGCEKVQIRIVSQLNKARL